MTKQFFSPVTELSSGFAHNPFDGILGLGLPILSYKHNQSSFINTAFKERQIVTNSFGMHLASTGARLHVGGADHNLYQGLFEEHPVDTTTGFWKLKGASVLVGKTVLVSGIDTILDSGTDLIFGPPDTVCPASLLLSFF